jgi:hypothetical protein
LRVKKYILLQSIRPRASNVNVFAGVVNDVTTLPASTSVSVIFCVSLLTYSDPSHVNANPSTRSGVLNLYATRPLRMSHIATCASHPLVSATFPLRCALIAHTPPRCARIVFNNSKLSLASHTISAPSAPPDSSRVGAYPRGA